MNRVRLAALALRTLEERVRVGVLLRTCPLDQCLQTLDRDPRSVRYSPDEIGRVTGRLLKNRKRPRTTCLQRALVRYSMLRRSGHTPTFLVGIDPDLDELEGHAWVLLDGVAFWETESLDCTPTFRYPPAHDDGESE